MEQGDPVKDHQPIECNDDAQHGLVIVHLLGVYPTCQLLSHRDTVTM